VGKKRCDTVLLELRYIESVQILLLGALLLTRCHFNRHFCTEHSCRPVNIRVSYAGSYEDIY